MKKKGERKKKITWYLFRKMFVFFFSFLYDERLAASISEKTTRGWQNIRTAAVDDRWQHLHALVQQQHFLPIKQISCWGNIYDEDFIFHSTLRRWRKRRDAIIIQHSSSIRTNSKREKLVSFSSFLTVLYERKSCCGKRVKKRKICHENHSDTPWQRRYSPCTFVHSTV